MAQAQATRTWVSGVGDDANPCSRTAPCKTFAGAISKTATDGEIDVMDPGGFGQVTIVKSITIDGTHGSGFGAILAASGSGVIINITNAADTRKTVRLRNLSINGQGGGSLGINVLAVNKLFVEECAIYGFQNSSASRGIKVALTAANSHISIKDTVISNCASGIDISTTVPLVLFTIDDVTAEGMTDGIILGGGANGIIRNSVISLNSGAGVKIISTGVAVGLESTEIAQCGKGVEPFNGSTTVFSNVTLLGNNVGISVVAGSTLTSHGNNSFALNGAGASVNNIGNQ